MHAYLGANVVCKTEAVAVKLEEDGMVEDEKLCVNSE